MPLKKLAFAALVAVMAMIIPSATSASAAADPPGADLRSLGERISPEEAVKRLKAEGRTITPAQSSPVPKSKGELQAQVDEVLSHKGGKQTALNEITWTPKDGGEVRLIFPVGTPQLEAEVQKSRANSVHAIIYSYGCPWSDTGGTRWSCAYENANFNGVSSNAAGPGNGRMLQFADSGVLQSLHEWNFVGMASSAYSTRANGTWTGLVAGDGWYSCAWHVGAPGGIGGLGSMNDTANSVIINGNVSC